MNIPKLILTSPSNHKNRMIKGIEIVRYGASWLRSGGDIDDNAGFILWMTNVPFKNKKGEIEYISQDDAQDAYDMMRTGKFELECNAREFLKFWDRKTKTYKE